jgi:hypothetical protein
LKRHPNAVTIHIINDIYDDSIHGTNVKQHEQQRRAETLGFTPNVYPTAEQKMPTGVAWRSFLSKSSNKHRLHHFPASRSGNISAANIATPIALFPGVSVWQHLSSELWRLKSIILYCIVLHFILQHWKRCMLSINMFYTVNKDCYNFQTEELDQNYAIPIPCEADTRAFYHAHRISKLQPDATKVYDFEDTDVWMVLSYLSHLSLQKYFMYKSQADQQLMFCACKTLFANVQDASAALGVYVFTGDWS